MGSFPARARRIELDFPKKSRSAGLDVKDDTDEDNEVRRGRSSAAPKTPGAVPRESTGDWERVVSMLCL